MPSASPVKDQLSHAIEQEMAKWAKVELFRRASSLCSLDACGAWCNWHHAFLNPSPLELYSRTVLIPLLFQLCTFFTLWQQSLFPCWSLFLSRRYAVQPQ